MTEDSEASVPTASRAPQHVRLFPVDDAYEHLCILTLLPSLGPLHLMLADALSPHGSNATLASVGTLSEGFERFVTSPLYLVGYVRWDARSDQSSFSNDHSNSFQVATRDTGLGEMCGTAQSLRHNRVRAAQSWRLPYSQESRAIHYRWPRAPEG